MKKYNQIKQEIAKLERQAEKIRRDELKGVIQQIKKTMAQHGITVDDLKGSSNKAAPTKGAKKQSAAGVRAKVAPKYRSKSDASQTWTGRGRKPLWVQEWLDAGKSLDDLLI